MKGRLVEGEREIVPPGVGPLRGHKGIEDNQEEGDRDPGLPVTVLRGGQDEEREDGEDQPEVREVVALFEDEFQRKDGRFHKLAREEPADSERGQGISLPEQEGQDDEEQKGNR